MAPLGPSCDRAEGLLAAANGEKEQAAAALRSALDGFERLRVPFEAARTREALAAVSSPEDAQPLLTQALDTYESLGARPLAERARLALKAATAP
jgi:hypothetical protein